MAKKVQIRLTTGNTRMTPWGHVFKANRPVTTDDARLISYAKANPDAFNVLDNQAIRDEETQQARRTVMARRKGALVTGDALPAPRPDTPAPAPAPAPAPEPVEEPELVEEPKVEKEAKAKKTPRKKAAKKAKAKKKTGGTTSKKKASGEGESPARKKA